MKISVKSWWYEQEQLKAQKYGWTLCWENVYKEDEDGTYYGEWLGKDLYNRGEAEKAGYSLFGEQVKETEKAVQMVLKFWNLRKAGRYVTDAPVEMKWKTWIPKSVLIQDVI